MSAPNILVVEDNPVARKLYRIVLGAEGYRVRDAGSAAEALALMREEPADLALLDFLLPDSSGVDLVRWLRALPGGADMPVLGVTGFLSRIEQAKAANAGFDEYIAKPVAPSVLVAVVARFLRGARASIRDSGSGRVLVADDNLTSRKLLVKQLRLAGYDVEAASDGAEALEMCLRAPPQAVVTDVLMPRLDGFKLCLAIRRNPRLAQVPVVMVSAKYCDEADHRLARRAGASAFVVRTPQETDVLEALHTALTRPPPLPEAVELPLGDYAECLLRQVERLNEVTAELEERAAVQAASLATLASIAASLAHGPRPDEELEEILGDVLTAAGVASGAIYLASPDGSLRAAAEYGQLEGAPSAAWRDDVCRQAITAKTTVSTAATAAHGVSAIVAPIGAGDAFFGALLMLSSRRDVAASEWTAFAETVAGQIGNGLALGRMVGELRRARDDLEARVSERTEQLRVANAELRLAKDAAESANRAKSAFLANMSHEIRTPMNAILGYTQLMQRDAGLAPAQQRQVAVIMRSGEHLLGLINDVLEMAKIEAGHRELAHETVDLRQLVEHLTRMFQLRVDAARVRFRVTGAAEVPRRIAGDAGKLSQVLMNLLGNAVKFTQQGAVSLRVSVETSASGEARLVAEVEDTGPGMTAAELAGLFRPFAQARAGIGVSGGTGLGLALSRELARLMGGDITVESEAGKGSLFRFEVPVELREDGPESDRAGAAAGQIVGIVGDEPRPGVLLVDDHEESRFWLRQLLEHVGFDVREAINGADALARFDERAADLVLMDLHMPIMNGYDAMRAIRARPAGTSTPIVAVTASAFDDERDAIFAAGADAWLRKPLRDGQVLEEIRKHLGVKYRHATEAASPSVLPSAAPPAPAPLEPELVTRLLTAVHLADYEGITDLLAEIPQENARFGAKLRRLAEAFAYEEIERLLRA